MGERAASTLRGLVIGVPVALTDENVGEGGARVRKKLVMGLQRVSLDEPSGHLERLGERKLTGSMFSASSLLKSDSYVWALRLVDEVRVVMARGCDVNMVSPMVLQWDMEWE